MWAGDRTQAPVRQSVRRRAPEALQPQQLSRMSSMSSSVCPWLALLAPSPPCSYPETARSWVLRPSPWTVP